MQSPGGGRINVGVVNCSSLSPADVAEGVAVLQKQVDQDFSPVWRVKASLRVLDQDPDPRYRDYWGLILLDSPKRISPPSAPRQHPDSVRDEKLLGYHDMTWSGRPMAKVFVGTTEADRKGWVHTASHELLEMLADPDLNEIVLVNPTAAILRIYAREVCDPVNRLGYDVDGVRVSDFVHPSWFGSGGSRLHQALATPDEITRPLELAKHGYIGFLDPATSTWRILLKGADGKERQTDLGKDDPDALGTLGSRNERRTTPRNRWVTSSFDWAP
jgi:hypothetical protein